MGEGAGPCKAVATSLEWALMKHESRGWPTADNPRSSALGCFQLLAPMRRAHYPEGCPADTLDVSCQMAGGRGYIEQRYGSTAAAVNHRRTRGWY